MPLFLLLLFLISPTYSQLSTCPSTPRPTNCLPSILTQPSLYKVCLTHPCYLFLSEPPFINIPSPAPPPPHKPFLCAKPFPYKGLSFIIHKYTPPALCIYAGPDCSFNDLFHFTAAYSNYSFGITGLLIHTPERLCNHTPASSIVEDNVVVIGRAPHPTGRRIDQLIRPFSTLTWLIFVCMVLLILAVACSIAFVTRGKPSLASAVFVAAGNSSALLRKHSSTQRCSDTSFLTPFAMSTTLLKISGAVLLTLLALFYEAGVVNFLFQQNTAELGKRVRSLSSSELAKYSVLKGSALEQVWNLTVNPAGELYDPVKEDPPWRRCSSAEECIRWVADKDNEVMFDVTFSTSARFFIPKLSSCDELTIFEPKDLLYRFTGGWLNNEAVPKDYRQLVDRTLISLRINRSLGEIFSEEFDPQACAENVSPQLGPLLILIPMIICVFPPLLGSMLMLFSIKEKKKEHEPNTAIDSSPALSGDNSILVSAEMSQISTSDVVTRPSKATMEIEFT